jgi:hypothetical protein
VSNVPFENVSAPTPRHPRVSRIVSFGSGFFLTTAAMVGLLSLGGMNERRTNLEIAIPLGIALSLMEVLWPTLRFRKR